MTTALLASSVNWTTVLVSLIAAVPSTVAALAALRVHRQIKTPSGPSVGKQTEQANALSALALGYLAALLKRNGEVPPSTEEAIANADEAATPIINGNKTPPLEPS